MNRSIPLSRAVSKYLKVRKSEGYAPTTLDGYKLHLNRLTRHLGDPDIHDIGVADLREYMATLDHLKLSSQATIIRGYRAFFKWLYTEEYLERDPAARLREPKLPERIPKALTMDELERLRDACRSERERAMVEVLFSTGARLSEFVGMNKADIDWQRKALAIIGKGNRQREVYLGAKAMLRLKRYLSTRGDRNPALFVTTPRYFNGEDRAAPRRLSTSAVGSEMKRIARRAGLGDKVTPHVIRHTFATMMLTLGADIYTTSKLLGHSRISTTEIYAKIVDKKKDEAMGLIDKFFDKE